MPALWSSQHIPAHPSQPSWEIAALWPSQLGQASLVAVPSRTCQPYGHPSWEMPALWPSQPSQPEHAILVAIPGGTVQSCSHPSWDIPAHPSISQLGNCSLVVIPNGEMPALWPSQPSQLGHAILVAISAYRQSEGHCQAVLSPPRRNSISFMVINYPAIASGAAFPWDRSGQRRIPPLTPTWE